MRPVPIRITIAAAIPPADAFALFTEGLTRWWPREYTWAQDTLVRIGMEPRLGGHCYELGPHDFRVDWGRVLAWEPPSRLVLAWQISPRREPQPNPAKASEVEIRFKARPPGGTDVTLEHRGFERHGAGGGDYRDALASEQGWPRILRQYASCAG